MIIGLSGVAQSGKDTVAELLVLNYSFKRLAFADGIKESLYRLNPVVPVFEHHAPLQLIVDEKGWDYAKGFNLVREWLQRMGTEVGREMFGEDIWVDQAFKQVEPDQRFVFTDVRFPNEARRIKEHGGIMWRINRHNHGAVNDHISEHAMDNFMFDHVIYNDGSLDDLADEVFMSAKKFHL